MVTKGILPSLIAASLLVVGCQNADRALSPTTGDVDPTFLTDEPPVAPATFGEATWDESAQAWRVVVDATSFDTPRTFNLTTGLSNDSDWQIQFQRFNVSLNGGVTGSGGVVGYDFTDSLSFAAASTLNARVVEGNDEWVEDEYDLQIDNWFDYDFQTFQLTINQNVYSMWDASGEHGVKFRVDSLVGAGMPPDMGTAYITYFYQTMAGNVSLIGPTQQMVVPIGPAPAYVDFSSGGKVFPSDPANSTDWDLRFFAYEIRQNTGPFGPGLCSAFPWYQELGDPTDINSVPQVAPGAPPFYAPTFPDGIVSVIGSDPNEGSESWFDYENFILTPTFRTYILKDGNDLYKIQLVGYYHPVTGQSGNISMLFSALTESAISTRGLPLP